MDSPKLENDIKQELDDSGCVQDASMTEKYRGQAHLLDLSDDVLLCILRLCSPRDLKALGHSCPRLGTLVCDRTLWQSVDTRAEHTGPQRLRWYLTHALSSATKELQLTGYVNRDVRCLGIQDLTWPMGDPSQANQNTGVEVEHFLLRMWYPHLPRYAMSPRWPDKREAQGKLASRAARKAKEKEANAMDCSEPASGKSSSSTSGSSSTDSKSSKTVSKSSQTDSKLTETDSKSSKSDSKSKTDSKPKQSDSKSGKTDSKSKTSQSKGTERPKDMQQIVSNCQGPQFTFNQSLLKMLRGNCQNLTSLSLEYCNLDYKETNLRFFPQKLKKLSLKGTMCYNLPVNTSYLGKIQDRLPELESLDISECEWFEPASLMPLSKVPNLQELYMKDCRKLTECVAYASLATRYGFQKLRIIDTRGSPVADSEVSAFGWLPLLEELYVSSPDDFRNTSEHSHKWEDVLAPFNELEDWESEAPEYYKCRSPAADEMDEDEDVKEEDESKCPGQRLGDMLGGYINCGSLERRIIVIHPSRDNRPVVHRVGARAEPNAAPNDGPNAEAPAAPNAGPNAGPPAAPNAEPPAGPNAGPLAGPKIGLPAGPIAGPNAGPPAGPIAGPSAGPIAKTPAESNTGPLAGSNAEPLAGPSAGAPKPPQSPPAHQPLQDKIPAEPKLGPNSGPSKRPHSDNAMDLVKRARIDENTSDDNNTKDHVMTIDHKMSDDISEDQAMIEGGDDVPKDPNADKEPDTFDDNMSDDDNDDHDKGDEREKIKENPEKAGPNDAEVRPPPTPVRVKSNEAAPDVANEHVSVNVGPDQGPIEISVNPVGPAVGPPAEEANPSGPNAGPDPGANAGPDPGANAGPDPGANAGPDPRAEYIRPQSPEVLNQDDIDAIRLAALLPDRHFLDIAYENLNQCEQGHHEHVLYCRPIPVPRRQRERRNEGNRPRRNERPAEERPAEERPAEERPNIEDPAPVAEDFPNRNLTEEEKRARIAENNENMRRDLLALAGLNDIDPSQDHLLYYRPLSCSRAYHRLRHARAGQNAGQNADQNAGQANPAPAGQPQPGPSRNNPGNVASPERFRLRDGDSAHVRIRGNDAHISIRRPGEVGEVEIRRRFGRDENENAAPAQPNDANQNLEPGAVNDERVIPQEGAGAQVPAGPQNIPILRRIPIPRDNREHVRHIDIDIHRQNLPIPNLANHLVSDAAVLRFGRADNDNVNYVHIGNNHHQHGPEVGVRPDRSNLRVLSITGFRNITDRSLEHLATAAPHLRSIDFSFTNVTAEGVEIFKAIRPNCKVVFSKYGQPN